MDNFLLLWIYLRSAKRHCITSIFPGFQEKTCWEVIVERKRVRPFSFLQTDFWYCNRFPYMGKLFAFSNNKCKSSSDSGRVSEEAATED